jgi:hypothetical protein
MLVSVSHAFKVCLFMKFHYNKHRRYESRKQGHHDITSYFFLSLYKLNKLETKLIEFIRLINNNCYLYVCIKKCIS